jgi:hypothetical protein
VSADDAAQARLLLVTGEVVEVDGRVEQVEKTLQDAARSTPGTLAWLRHGRTGEPLAVNPAHVVTLGPGDD